MVKEYPGSTVIEIVSTARHNGNGYAVEIFVISSDQASVILVRRGLMRSSGLDTKFNDIQIMRGAWQKEADHQDAALREATRLLETYNKEEYQGNFDDDPSSPAHLLRKRNAFVDMRNHKEGFRFQWAIEHLFSDAMFHNMLWELFPDMTEDFTASPLEIEELDSEEIANKQRSTAYAAWGEF